MNAPCRRVEIMHRHRPRHKGILGRMLILSYFYKLHGYPAIPRVYREALTCLACAYHNLEYSVFNIYSLFVKGLQMQIDD